MPLLHWSRTYHFRLQTPPADDRKRPSHGNTQAHPFDISPVGVTLNVMHTMYRLCDRRYAAGPRKIPDGVLALIVPREVMPGEWYGGQLHDRNHRGERSACDRRVPRAGRNVTRPTRALIILLRAPGLELGLSGPATSRDGVPNGIRLRPAGGQERLAGGDEPARV